MLRLEKINAENVWDIVKLHVTETQQNFVAPNGGSIIEAYTTIGTNCSAFPFGIYDDETPVGFLMIGFNLAALDEMLGHDTRDIFRNNYSLWRLMIDQHYQKRGYGKEAVKLALEFIRTWPCGKADYCELSYEPENEVAKRLYASFGFVENGEMDGDEIIALLKL